MADVTARINAATMGRSGKHFRQAEQAAIAKVESGCSRSAAVLCEVVTLYGGGVYALYTYNRFQDVRLVFSVEDDAANFGGDPDNFEYPRYDIDVAFLRVYVDGKPLTPLDHFKFETAPAKPGDVVLSAGNPWTTNRDDTVAQLEFLRDYDHPIACSSFPKRWGCCGRWGGKVRRCCGSL